MQERAKIITLNALVAAVLALALFAGSTQYRQWAQFKRGEQALAARDYIQAVAGFESAIHMYTPFSPLVESSATKLWSIGETLEQRGDTEKALIAYRALRSSFYSTHGLFKPGMEWITRCDRKITALARPVQPAQ